MTDEMIRCPACRGRKQVEKLGGVVGDCNTCKAEGKIKACDKPVIVIPVVDVASIGIIDAVSRMQPSQIDPLDPLDPLDAVYGSAIADETAIEIDQPIVLPEIVKNAKRAVFKRKQG